MDFYRIEYFLVLAKTLNFVEASKQLYITPQALSKQIILLEQEIGDKLFDRTTRKVKLTELGQICYTQFSKVKTQYDLALNDILHIVRSKKEIIRIGLLSALPKNEVIMPILQIISETCPKLNYEILAEGLEEVRDLLIKDEIDLCFSNVHEFEDWSEYKVVKLATMPAKIVISLYHPWVMKDRITEEDMQNEGILLYKMNHPLEENSFYNKITCKYKHYVNNFDTMLATLEIGKEFAVFPKVFDYMYKAKFKYFDLPEHLKFEYYTVAICKKTNTNNDIENILSNLKEYLHLDKLLK